MTGPERAAFNAIVDAQFTDVVRPFTPGPAVYTYWDYTQLRFPKNRGMRIDFILGSPALAQRVSHAEIVREERKRARRPAITRRCWWNSARSQPNSGRARFRANASMPHWMLDCTSRYLASM